MIPVLEPYLDSTDRAYVKKALNSGFVSSLGIFVPQFENEVSRLFKNSKYHCASTSSGTLALEIALKSLNLKKGSLIAVTNFTFGATINAICNIGAKPIFFEPNLDTFNLDESIFYHESILRKCKALVLVSAYGLPFSKKFYQMIRKRLPKLFIIEDSAESFGSYRDNFHAGSLADICTFSFYGNKNITTGEGGMIVTQDKKLHKKCLILKNHGMSPKIRYEHIELGTNARMTNIQAALGCAQIKKLKFISSKKREIRNIYLEKLKNFDVSFQDFSNEGKEVPWLNVIIFKNEKTKKKVIKEFKKSKIDFRNPFSPMSNQYAFSKFKKVKSSNNSMHIFSHGLCLPSSVSLKKSEQMYIISKIKKILSSE